MRISRFDTETYIRTKDLSGGPIYGMVEEEIPEMDVACDVDGNPTRGGLIGYHLVSTLLVALLLYLYVAL